MDVADAAHLRGFSMGVAYIAKELPQWNLKLDKFCLIRGGGAAALPAPMTPMPMKLMTKAFSYYCKLKIAKYYDLLL